MALEKGRPYRLSNEGEGTGAISKQTPGTTVAIEYGKRLQAASWKEFRRFWSGFRLLVTLSGLIAPAIVQLHRGVHSAIPLAEAVESGMIGITLSVAGTYLYARRKGAEALDAELNYAIRECDEALRNLRKPARTPSEEHHYSAAKAALAKLGPECGVALRHLIQHESLTFGSIDPPAPKGMIARDLHAYLNLCSDENLVSRRGIAQPGGFTYVYTIAPGMRPALEELLYYSG